MSYQDQEYHKIINQMRADATLGAKKPIDTSLPSILWEIDTKITAEQSILQTLFTAENTAKICQADIEEQKKIYDNLIANIDQEEEKQLVSDKRNRQEQIENLQKQIFDIKKSLTEGKECAIKEAIFQYQTQEKELINSHIVIHQSKLKEYKAMLAGIDKILNSYKISYNKDVESLEIEKSSLTSEVLWGLIKTINEEMHEIVNSNENTISSIKGKINQLSTTKKIVGATVLGLSTALFAPAAILASGVTVASVGKTNSFKKEQLEVSALALVRTRKSIEELIKETEKESSELPSLNYLKKELEQSLQEIKDSYQVNIEELKIKNQSLVKKLESLNSTEVENAIKELMQNKREKETDQFNIQTRGLQDRLNDCNNHIEKTKRLLQQRQNKIPNIFNTYAEDLEKTIKGYKDSNGNKILGSKEILNKFRKYSLLARANIDENTPLTDELRERNPLRYKQIEYDRNVLKKQRDTLFVELQQFYNQGQDENFWLNRYKADNQNENAVYILDESKIHLGELKTKYSSMVKDQDLKEQIFADNWDNGSVLFTYNSDKEYTYITNFVKNIIQQTSAILTPSNLQVNIISETITTEFNDICVNTNTFDKFNRLVKNRNYISAIDPAEIENELKDINLRINKMQKNDLVGGMSFKELIKAKRAIFSTTRPYVINVIVLDNANSKFLDICKTSKSTGVINYIIARKDTIIKKNENNEDEKDLKKQYEIQDNLRNQLKYCSAIVELDEIDYEKNIVHLNEFVYSTSKCRPFKYYPKGKDEVSRNREHLENRVKKSFGKASNLNIIDFILDVLGDDLWSKCADKHIELYFGYLDGDMAKPFPVILESDSKPHMFLGGTTGGGKSVTLAFMTDILKLTYSPKELVIYYFDFKVVEVGIHREPYKWTSAKSLSGSKEPDYVKSLLDAVLAEMNNRNEKYFERLGAKDFAGYRKKQREKVKELIEKGYPERAKKVPYYPRILVIIDEYVAGITEDTKEFMQYATEQIARLARSCGMNFLAVSQDPGGKIPSNIFELFAVRACTKATKPVSKEIMKSDFCGRQENQFLGFLGVNDSGIGDEDRNMQYLVPYASEDDTRLITKLVYDKCMQEDPSMIIDSVNYDDNSLFLMNDLNKYLEHNITEPGTIYLGEKVFFMEKFEPANVKLTNGSNQNIVLLTSNDDDKIAFIKSVLASINDCKEESKILFMYSKDKYDKFNPEKYLDKPEKKCISGYDKIRNMSYLEMVNKFPIDRDLLETYTPMTKDIEFRENLNLSAMFESDEDVYYEPSLYMSETDYLERPTSYNKINTPEDKSFTGFIYNNFTNLIEYQKTILPEVNFIKSDLPKLYIFLIDPEKDKNVMTDRFFNNKEFISLVASLGDYNIHIITVTSKGMIASAPIFNYVAVLNSSQEEIFNISGASKHLKNLSKDMGKCLDIVTITNSFKYKPIKDEKRELLPWEVD